MHFSSILRFNLRNINPKLNLILGSKSNSCNLQGCNSQLQLLLRKGSPERQETSPRMVSVPSLKSGIQIDFKQTNGEHSTANYNQLYFYHTSFSSFLQSHKKMRKGKEDPKPTLSGVFTSLTLFSRTRKLHLSFSNIHTLAISATLKAT